jgi:hypothetical protein
MGFYILKIFVRQKNRGFYERKGNVSFYAAQTLLFFLGGSLYEKGK